MAAQPSSRPDSADVAPADAAPADVALVDEPRPVPPPAPTAEMRQTGPGELSQDWSSWFTDAVTMPLYRWRTHLVLLVSLVVLLWLGFKAADRIDDGIKSLPTTTTTAVTPSSTPLGAVPVPEPAPVPATPPTDASPAP